jgi:hypothetical protein
MAGYAFTLVLPTLTITDFGDETHDNNEDGITITGLGFEAAQGNGFVEIVNSSTYASATVKSKLTIQSWSDTAIVVNMCGGGLPSGTNYVVVTTDTGTRSNLYTFTLNYAAVPSDYRGVFSTADASSTNLLGADHYWTFNNSITDAVGTQNLTATGTTYAATQLCDFLTNSGLTDARTDHWDAPTGVATIGDQGTIHCVAGWFQVSSIQGPPCIIFSEYDTTEQFQILLGYGNTLLFGCSTATTSLQLYSDVIIDLARPYHVMAKFDVGTGKFEAFLDGLPVTTSLNSSDFSDIGTLPARSQIEFGSDRAGTGIGGQALTLASSTNMNFSSWAMWSGNYLPNESETRIDMFGRGTLANATITTQAGLSTLNNSTVGSANTIPAGIIIEGNGTIDLTATNIIFDDKLSVDIVYTGTGTVNFTNSGTSNAVTFISTSGGTVNIINNFNVTFTGAENNTEIRIFSAGTITELDGIENTSGDFVASLPNGLVDVRIVSIDFKIREIFGLSVTQDFSFQVDQFVDRVYENPA